MEACSSESTASASEIFYIYVRTRSYYSCLENDRRRRQYYCVVIVVSSISREVFELQQSPRATLVRTAARIFN